MPTKAIEKIKSEMTKNNTNSYIQAVGGFLLQHLESNPQDAEKILVADKTVGKSLDEMRKAAQKKKVGSCAVLTDQEGFAIVLKYFGIDTKPSEYVPKPVESVTEKVISNDKSNYFDIKLEDLL
jgi:hypothetical protein